MRGFGKECSEGILESISCRQGILTMAREVFPLISMDWGKTFQYLLASVRVDPPLGRRETAKLKKIISKCQRYNSKHSYQSVQEICKDLPIYQIPKEKRKQKKGKRIAAAGILILLILFGKRYFLSAREPQKRFANKRLRRGGNRRENDRNHRRKKGERRIEGGSIFGGGAFLFSRYAGV